MEKKGVGISFFGPKFFNFVFFLLFFAAFSKKNLPPYPFVCVSFVPFTS